MHIHICTNESLVAGGEEIELKCPVCLITSKQTVGFAGCLCRKCGNLTNDEWKGFIARLRREYLGKSRRDIAKALGILPATIRQYETVKCSKKYFDRLGELVEIHNKQHTRSTA